MKSVRIRSFSGLYSVQMRENTDQKNFEYGQGLCSETFLDILRSGLPYKNYSSSIKVQLNLNDINKYLHLI